MKIQLYSEGPLATAALAEFLPKFQAARQADRDNLDAYWAGKEAERASAAPQPMSDATSEHAGDAVAYRPASARKPGRYWGEAAKGKQRRTKEELAIDAELDALATALDKSVLAHATAPAAELLVAWRAESNAGAAEVVPEAEKFVPKLPEMPLNISTTPEDRKDPANPEPVDEIVATVVPTATKVDIEKALSAIVAEVGPDKFLKIRVDLLCGHTGLSVIPEAEYGRVLANIQAFDVATVA